MSNNSDPLNLAGNQEIADNVARLDVASVKVSIAEGFKIASTFADKENLFDRFDGVNPQLRLPRVETVQCFTLPYEDDFNMPTSSKETFARAARTGAGAVALALGRNDRIKKEVKKLSPETIADHLNAAYQLTDRSNTVELNQVVGEIKKAYPAIGCMFDLLKEKSVDLNALNTVLAGSEARDRGRYVEAFRRAGFMMTLAVSGAMGLTDGVKPANPTDLSNIYAFEAPMPLTPYTLAHQPFNRYGFSVEGYFIENKVALEIYKDLTDLYYEDHPDVDSQSFKGFSEVCFGALNSLCSNRQVNLAINNMDENIYHSIVGQAYKRAGEVSWVIDEDTVDIEMNTPLPEDLVRAYSPLVSDAEDQGVILSVNEIPFFKGLLDKIEQSIMDNIRHNDSTQGRINAMRHGGMAVALTLYRSAEMQAADARLLQLAS